MNRFRDFGIGFALALALVGSMATVAAQSQTRADPLDAAAEANLATVELGNATFHLDANLPEVGCSVEIAP